MGRILSLLITIIGFSALNTSLMAQTNIYKGQSTYSFDILYTWDGRHLYKGRSTYSFDILYTIDGAISLPILTLFL